MKLRSLSVLLLSIGVLLLIQNHPTAWAYYNIILDDQTSKTEIFDRILDPSKFKDIGQGVLDDSAAEISQLQQQLEAGGLGDALAEIEAIQTSIKLTSTPLYPAPNQLVTLTLDDYSIKSTGATINWLVDGVVAPAWQNQRSIQAVAPSLGEKRTFTVQLQLPSGVTTSAELVIAPVRIDVVIEGQTSVPTHYRGRSMPIQRTPIRATAIVFDSTGPAATDLSYRWSVDGTIVSGGPLRGGSSYIFTPPLRRSVPITVEVFNRQGIQIGRSTVETPLVEPEVLFYEVNPLRGLGYRALSQNITFSGSELALRAAPYYFSASLNPNQLIYIWELNNRAVPTDTSNPSELIIQTQGGTGTGVVELNVRNPQEILQRVTSRLRIQY